MAMIGNDTACVYSPTPPIEEYPIDGFGGTYYELAFPVPVYTLNDTDFSPVYTTSWRKIDEYYQARSRTAAETAVAFGICLATLLNVLVLTPRSKRRLLLHHLICLALLTDIIRSLAHMTFFIFSLPASAYVTLTGEMDTTQLSGMCHALITISQVSACVGFMLVQACFFIQCRTLMTWLALHNRIVYYSILTYLVVAGLLATVFRVGLAVCQIVEPRNSDQPIIIYVLLPGKLVLYALSLGSWSMVFFVSAVSIIITRRKSMLRRDSVYDTALNLLAIVGLESFIVPITFCLLYFVHDAELSQLERFVVPSVLFLFPVCGLFSTTYGTDATKPKDEPATNVGKASHRHVGRDLVQCMSDKFFSPDDQTGLLHHGNEQLRNSERVQPGMNRDIAGRQANHGKPVSDMVDLELALIDAMEQHVESIEIDNYCKG